MSQVTLPLSSLGLAGATTAVDVVRLALAYLNGGTPQGSAPPAPNGTAGNALLTGQVLPGQGAAIPGAAGQTSLQQGAVLAKGVVEGRADLLARNTSLPPAAGRVPEGTVQSDNRSAARDVLVAGRPHHAALVMRSHGAIAGLLRADAVLQIADSVLRKIDDRLARMQDLARRAAAGPISGAISGPVTRDGGAALDPLFQKLKQDVVELASPLGSRGKTVMPSSETPRAGARVADGVTSARPAGATEVPAVKQPQPLPALFQALAQAGLSTQTNAAEAGVVLAAARGDGGEVRYVIGHQRQEIGTLLLQELSRRIGLADPLGSLNAPARAPAAQLTAAVASALLVQPLPVIAGAAVWTAVPDGEGAAVGSAGKPVRQVSADSLALLIAQPSRAGLVALLSPSAGSLDELGVTMPQNMAPMVDRPLPVPPPVSGMAAELLFGLVPGWRARSRDGLARPKRPSGPQKKRRPRRKGDDPYA